MIILILLLALGLRVWNVNQSLWLDEAAQVFESLPTPDLIIHNMAGTFHPPLYHILMHYWLYFGRYEWMMRGLSVIVGVISVYFIYRLGQKLFNQKTALIAALLLAINPFAVYFSQEMRPYMFSMSLGIVCVLTFYQAITKGKFWWAIFIVCSTLNFYTTYFAGFLLLSQGLYLVFQKEQRKHLFAFILSSGVSFLLFIPWLPNIIDQLKISAGIARDLPGWSDAVSTPVVKTIPLTLVKFMIGQINFTPAWRYGLIAGTGVLIWLFIIQRGVQRTNQKWVYLAWTFSIGLLLPVLFSAFLQIAAPKRLIYLLPFLLLLLSYGLVQFSKKLFYPLLVCLVAMNLWFLSIYQTNPQFQRENWREAIKKVELLGDKNSLIVFKFTGPFAPYLFYQAEPIPQASVATDLQVTQEKLQSDITEHYHQVFVFQYLGALTDAQHLTEQRLTALKFEKKDTFDFPGVGLIDYYIK